MKKLTLMGLVCLIVVGFSSLSVFADDNLKIEKRGRLQLVSSEFSSRPYYVNEDVVVFINATTCFNSDSGVQLFVYVTVKNANGEVVLQKDQYSIFKTLDVDGKWTFHTKALSEVGDYTFTTRLYLEEQSANDVRHDISLLDSEILDLTAAIAVEQDPDVKAELIRKRTEKYQQRRILMLALSKLRRYLDTHSASFHVKERV